ncbi:hypothetical protein ABK040_010784 [Willaertia magna]
MTTLPYLLSLLDSISYWTIFDFVSITSYSSILLVNKEWNEHLVGLPKFKKNKEICLEINRNKYRLNAYITTKNENNYDVIIYLLKICPHYFKSIVFQKCHPSFRESKEIIYRSFSCNNGPNIFSLLPVELQKDKDILQRVCVFSDCYYQLSEKYFSDNEWLDYDFCKNLLNICKDNKSAHSSKQLLKKVKNKQAITDFIDLNTNNSDGLKILLNLENEILKDQFILTKLMNSKISKQSLNNYLYTNLNIFDYVPKDILKQYILEKNFLITHLYNKFTKDEIIEMCSSKIFILKTLYKFNNYLNKNDISDIVKKNVKVFKVLPREYRSILSSRTLVEYVIEKDSEMINYVSNLTENEFNNLVKKNEDLNRVKGKLLFKK